MNKNRHLTFRCTQEEYDLIQSARGSMELSDYIRSCIFSEEEDDIPMHLSPEETARLQDQLNQRYSNRLKALCEDELWKRGGGKP